MTINHAILSCAPKHQPHTIAIPSNLYDTLVEKARLYDEIVTMRNMRHSANKDAIFHATLDVCCRWYNQNKIDVLSQCRARKLMDVRKAVIYCLVEFKFTQQDIATFLNRKDHTTVINTRDTVHDLMSVDRGYRNEIQHIYNKVKLAINDLQKHS